MKYSYKLVGKKMIRCCAAVVLLETCSTRVTEKGDKGQTHGTEVGRLNGLGIWGAPQS